MFPKKKQANPLDFGILFFLVPTGRKKIVAEKTAEIIRLSGFMFFFLTFFCCRFIPKNLALFLRPVVSLTALSDEGRKKIGEPHWLIYGPVNIGASIRQRVANIPLFYLQWNERLKRRIFFWNFKMASRGGVLYLGYKVYSRTFKSVLILLTFKKS